MAAGPFVSTVCPQPSLGLSVLVPTEGEAKKGRGSYLTLTQGRRVPKDLWDHYPFALTLHKKCHHVWAPFSETSSGGPTSSTLSLRELRLCVTYIPRPGLAQCHLPFLDGRWWVHQAPRPTLAKENLGGTFCRLLRSQGQR